jgi:hypothetical protein
VRVKKKRDYKKEYEKYGKTDAAKKYRAELNQYNRENGTYGNGDKKDAAHGSNGKIVGYISASKNRAHNRPSKRNSK